MFNRLVGVSHGHAAVKGSDAVLMCIMVCICGRYVKVYYARGILIEWYTMTERAEYLFE